MIRPNLVLASLTKTSAEFAGLEACDSELAGA